jgi:hypothetical protein
MDEQTTYVFGIEVIESDAVEPDTIYLIASPVVPPDDEDFSPRHFAKITGIEG